MWSADQPGLAGRARKVWLLNWETCLCCSSRNQAHPLTSHPFPPLSGHHPRLGLHPGPFLWLQPLQYHPTESSYCQNVNHLETPCCSFTQPAQTYRSCTQKLIPPVKLYILLLVYLFTSTIHLPPHRIGPECFVTLKLLNRDGLTPNSEQSYSSKHFESLVLLFSCMSVFFSEPDVNFV